jgi:hypothetical protein
VLIFTIVPDPFLPEASIEEAGEQRIQDNSTLQTDIRE